MIQRPKRDEFEPASGAGALQAAAAAAAEATRDVRDASSSLARATILLVLLQLLLLPILVWFQVELAAWASLIALYAALGLAAATFWMKCGKPEATRRLSLKRERLEDWDDIAEMRARLLADEAAARARSAPPPSPHGEPRCTE